MVEINKNLAEKVLEVVDYGLVSGLGTAEPGKMCVEAAVCYALGQPHGDEPSCVGKSVRAFKIILNDSNWSADKARASGMRKLAVAQLGSDTIDQVEFVKELSLGIVNRMLPVTLRSLCALVPSHEEALEKCASDCLSAQTLDAASKAARDAASYASNAASYAARDAANAAGYASNAASCASYAASKAARDAASCASYAVSAASAASCAASKAASNAAGYASNAASYAARDAANAAGYASNAASKAASNAAGCASNAASAASNAASAASNAASDEILILAADIGLQALIKLKSPGAEFLYLCD